MIKTVVLRVLMVGGGAGMMFLLVPHTEGFAQTILIAGALALIGVPLYNWIPGDFDKAKDKAKEVVDQFRGKNEPA